MLGNHPITPVLLATDLAAAREFYHGKLGLQIDRENENAIVFRCGNGTHLDVTESTVGTAGQQTQAAWQVSDIRADRPFPGHGITSPGLGARGRRHHGAVRAVRSIATGPGR